MRWWPCMVCVGDGYKVGHCVGGGFNCFGFSLSYSAFGCYMCGYIYIVSGLELGVLLASLG